MFKTKKGNLKSLDYKKQDYVIKLSNTNFDNLKNVLDSKIGLNNQSRANNLLKFGSNQIVVKKFSVFKKILETLVEPFNLLLLFPYEGIASYSLIKAFGLEDLLIPSSKVILLLLINP